MSQSLGCQGQPLAKYCDGADGGRIIRWGNIPRWQSTKYKRVWVDVRKLDASLQLENGHYVGLFGLGGIAGKYEGVEQFLASGKAGLGMTTVCLRTRGDLRFVGIYDGRHRFAWMRDHGALALPVASLIGEACEVEKLVGSKIRRCRVSM